MFGAIEMQQLVDGAFALFVSGMCIAAYVNSTNSRSGKWRGELQALEGALRELIAEAGTASSSLDRTLLRRKEELKTLIEQIEALKSDTPVDASAKSAHARTKKPTRPAAKEKRVRQLEEFPNDSWMKETEALSEDDALLALSDEAVDQVEIGGKTSKALALSDQVEIVRDESEFDEETMTLSRAIDPSALRIAKRLLKGGREIHVVARKLDLPIAQVRVIDAMLQREVA